MPRFFRRLAEGVFDEEDLKRRTHEWRTSSVRQRSITNSPPTRSSPWLFERREHRRQLVLLRPETLHAAVLFRAMVPLVPEKLPDLSSARLWIGAEIRIQSFQFPRLGALSNSFAVRGRRLLFVCKCRPRLDQCRSRNRQPLAGRAYNMSRSAAAPFKTEMALRRCCLSTCVGH